MLAGRLTMILLTTLLMVTAALSCCQANDPEFIRIKQSAIENTQKILSKINSGLAPQERVVLFFGNTKSGVSSLVKILAQNGGLFANRTESGDLVIDDGGRAISSSLLSRTIYPNSYRVQDAVFYDLPGINTQWDDQTIINDAYTNIITSNIIQRALKRFKTLKLVFVFDVNQLNHENVVEFVLKVKKLIPNFESYKKGVMLVVNKVESNLKNEEFVRKIEEKLKMIKNSVRHDITLYDSDKNYTENVLELLQNKVVIMRKPTVVGELNKNRDIMILKQFIMKYIQGLEYVNKGFGEGEYPFSERSKQLIKDIDLFINHNITAIFKPLPLHFQEHHERRIAATSDIRKVVADVTIEYDKLMYLANNMDDIKTIDDFSQLLEVYLESFGVVYPDSVKKQLPDVRIFMAYSAIMIDSFKDITLRLANESLNVKQWYSFVYDLYDVLSEKSKLGEEIREVGKVSADNFDTFLELAASDDQPLTNIKASERKIEEINLVLNRTSEDDLKIRIDGEFVQVSGDSISACAARRAISNTFIPSFVDVIAITAHKNIIFDCNVTVDEGLSLMVAAPHWIVRSNTFIKLIGKNGENFQNPADVNKNGAPGKPGGPGGNFLGIGKNINGLGLSVSSIGGRGGDGQEGGRGLNGQIDKIANSPVIGSKCYIALGEVQSEKESVHQKLFFDPEACGGDGKDGGRGGFGGKHGHIVIKTFGDEPTNINVNLEDGLEGRNGSGGDNGLGGGAENVIDAYCSNVTGCSRKHDFVYPEWLHPKGNQGVTGGNSEDQQPPIPETSSSSFNIALEVYKNDLESEKNPFFRRDAEIMLALIKNAYILEQFQVPDGYYKEFGSLSVRFHNQNESRIIQKGYQEFLNKLEHYSPADGDHTLLMVALQASTFTKIFNFSDEKKFMVPDMKKYLNESLNNIKMMAEYMASSDRENILSLERSLYDKERGEILDKVSEITNVISELKPVISNKYGVVTESLERLTNDKTKRSSNLSKTQKNINKVISLQAVVGYMKLVQDTVVELVNVSKFLVENGRSDEDFDEVLQPVFEIFKQRQVSTNKFRDALLELFKLKHHPKESEMELSVNNHKKAMSLFFTFESFSELIELLMRDNKLDLNRFKCVVDALKESKSSINISKFYIKRLNRMVGNMMEQIGLQQNGKGISVKKWDLPLHLEKIFAELNKWSKRFSELDKELEALKFIMVSSFGVFENTDQVGDRRTLLRQMSNMLSPAMNSQNETVQYKLNYLREEALHTTLTAEFNMATLNFQQFVFPFANLFADNYKLENVDDFEAVVSEIEEVYGIFYSGAENYLGNELTGQVAEFGTFDRTSKGPFMTWNNALDIERLLRGDNVILSSLPGLAKHQDYFVKMDNLKLEIKLKKNDSVLEEKLQRLLKDYTVELNHLGVSFFNSPQGLYYVSHQNKEYRFSYVMDSDDPENTVEYQEVMTGDLMLSPFTFWKIGLDKKVENKVDEDLTQLENNLYLELSGNAVFVPQQKVQDLSLHMYYRDNLLKYLKK